MKRLLSSATCVALAVGLMSASAVAANAADLNPSNMARSSSSVRGEGATGISGWAVVGADATLVRKLNAKSASSLATGEYEVGFNSKITKCAYIAMIAAVDSVGNFGQPSTVLITGRGGNPRALFVETFDSSGARANRPFHVQVIC